MNKHSPSTIQVSPFQGDFNLVIERVTSLVQEAEDEESGIVPPTEYALATTLKMLRAAYPLVEGRFPRAAVSTDDVGGISVYWMKPGRSVQLTVPADEHGPNYLYYREGTNSELDKDVTASSLTRRLSWFASE